MKLVKYIKLLQENSTLKNKTEVQEQKIKKQKGIIENQNMKIEMLERMVFDESRDAMLESNQILLANQIEKLKKEKSELEKIIKKQDLEIQRLSNGKQQELF